MELEIFERKEIKKSSCKCLRSKGNIPGVIYTAGKKNENIFFKKQDFSAVLRRIEKNKLSTTIFTLIEGKKKKRKAIIKDIQYDLTSYDILHLDFEELDEKREVKIKIPISLKGVAECVGVKAGGVMRQVIRYLSVKCLPKSIPHELFIDVSDLEIERVKRLSDVVIPKEIKPLDCMTEVAVVVGKR